MPSPPDLNWSTLVSLLTEAREHITDKPWDDTTRLHERISLALGLPVSYPEHGREHEEKIRGALEDYEAAFQTDLDEYLEKNRGLRSVFEIGSMRVVELQPRTTQKEVNKQ